MLHEADRDPDGPQYARGISVDAVTKCNHFTKCGQATKAIPPIMSCYFSQAETEIRELRKEDKLNLHDYVDADAEDGEIRMCNAEMHCAREEVPTSTGGPCDH
jgi:hypothetical protein